MKKYLLALCCLLAVDNMAADDVNLMTIGENGTLRVYPNTMANGMEVPVRAHFTGRLDDWRMTFTCPSGMQVWSMTRREGMNVYYIDRLGAPALLAASLNISHDYTEASSKITELGYWDDDNDGIFVSYGTVKWEAGDYDRMFDVQFEFTNGFTGGILYINGQLQSDSDYRGGTIGMNPVQFSDTITVVVGYRPGAMG